MVFCIFQFQLGFNEKKVVFGSFCDSLTVCNITSRLLLREFCFSATVFADIVFADTVFADIVFAIITGYGLYM
jgi:hypothetical protein